MAEIQSNSTTYPRRRLSPRISTKDLHSDLNPETLYLRLVVTEGHAEIVQTPTHPSQFISFHLNLKDNTLDLPRYSSRDITVASKLMGSGYIAKVSTRGLDMCCKISTTQSFKAVQREYDCLRQIKISKIAASIPARTLFGLVVDDDDGVIFGILEELITNEGRLSDLVKR